MSRGRLTVALSSLLLIVAILPSLEAKKLKCLRGGFCDYPGNPFDYKHDLEEKKCKDACFHFGCLVDGYYVGGWGCEKHLKAACPVISDADIEDLKYQDNDVAYIVRKTYGIQACKYDDCFLDLETEKDWVNVIGHEGVDAYGAAWDANRLESDNTKRCEYDDSS